MTDEMNTDLVDKKKIAKYDKNNKKEKKRYLKSILDGLMLFIKKNRNDNLIQIIAEVIFLLGQKPLKLSGEKSTELKK